MREITITVNGQKLAAEVEPRTSLGDFLRGHQDLTGTHFGCEHGVCGACTVLINGVPARSCIAFAVALEDADIRTIEGFEDDPVMAAVRDAFHRDHAVQCGFCTSGMLITARDIVSRFAEADENRIRSELAGNLCRCTGYMGIVNAIQRVLREVPASARLGKMATRTNGAERRTAFQPFAAKSQAHDAAATARAGTKEELNRQGWYRLTDSFVVDKPRAEVWRFLSDLPRMAACMPGAHLSESKGRSLKGEMRVAFGPIRAGFAGTATSKLDDKTFTGMLEGGGSDTKSGSRAKGQVSYRLVEIDGGVRTCVELALDYHLQGTLAQFGRSGLVKDFASRLIAEFSRNLADELAGRRRGTASAPRELHATGLIWSVLWSRFKGLFVSKSS